MLTHIHFDVGLKHNISWKGAVDLLLSHRGVLTTLRDKEIVDLIDVFPALGLHAEKIEDFRKAGGTFSGVPGVEPNWQALTTLWRGQALRAPANILVWVPDEGLKGWVSEEQGTLHAARMFDATEHVLDAMRREMRLTWRKFDDDFVL